VATENQTLTVQKCDNLTVLIRNQGMRVLDAFKGHLILDVKSVFYTVNNDLVVIPGGMTSQLHYLKTI
jgi:hypothetical protein